MYTIFIRESRYDLCLGGLGRSDKEDGNISLSVGGVVHVEDASEDLDGVLMTLQM